MKKIKTNYKILLILITFITLTTTLSWAQGLVNGPTKAERIVVNFPMGIGLLYVSGLSNNIVGIQVRSMHIYNGHLGEFYQRISPNFKKLVDIGGTGTTNIESVLKLNPDLVLTHEPEAQSGALFNVLHKNKIPTIHMKAMNGNLDDWLEAVQSFAKATNTEARATAYSSYMKECIELITNRTKHISPKDKPKVAFINTNRGNMILRGVRTRFMFHMLKLVGAATMADGEDPADSNTCAEMLFKFDPIIIIDDSRSNEFYSAAWWDMLKPVKNNKVYKTPQDDDQAWVTNWSQPTYSPLGLLWLAKIVHPKLFSDVDLKKEHEKFCNILYGESLSDMFPKALKDF
jgi:iron complex transport system substrate-binding protein